jgi:hypothetical protein
VYITYIYIHLYVLSQWLVVLKKGVHMCCPLYVQCFHSYLISSEYIHCCERYCMLLHQMAVPWRPSIPTPSVHTYRFGKLLRLFCKHWTTCHTAYASSRLAVAAHSFQTTLFDECFVFQRWCFLLFVCLLLLVSMRSMALLNCFTN